MQRHRRPQKEDLQHPCTYSKMSHQWAHVIIHQSSSFTKMPPLSTDNSKPIEWQMRGDSLTGFDTKTGIFSPGKQLCKANVKLRPWLDGAFVLIWVWSYNSLYCPTASQLYYICMCWLLQNNNSGARHHAATITMLPGAPTQRWMFIHQTPFVDTQCPMVWNTSSSSSGGKAARASLGVSRRRISFLLMRLL